MIIDTRKAYGSELREIFQAHPKLFHASQNPRYWEGTAAKRSHRPNLNLLYPVRATEGGALEVVSISPHLARELRLSIELGRRRARGAAGPDTR